MYAIVGRGIEIRNLRLDDAYNMASRMADLGESVTLLFINSDNRETVVI